jgi:hypothetical protein
VDDKAVKKGIDAVDNRLGRIVAKAR